MSDERELAIELRSGMGCTGLAFRDLKPVIAVLTSGWGTAAVPPATEQALDPRLRWIISTPVPDPDVHGGFLGILNLDGLDRTQNESRLRLLLDDLKAVADELGRHLKRIS
jgi:hypothetical protein